jgi:hypothetical protein
LLEDRVDPLLSARARSLSEGPLGRTSPRSHLLTSIFVTFKLLTEPFTLYLGCLSVAVVERLFSIERTRHKTQEVRCAKVYTRSSRRGSLCSSNVSVFTGCRDWAGRRPNQPWLWLSPRLSPSRPWWRMRGTTGRLSAQGGAGRRRSGKLPAISPNVPRIVLPAGCLFQSR